MDDLGAAPSTAWLDHVDVVLPGGVAPRLVEAARRVAPFSQARLDFVENLGKRLRSSPETRKHPELVALGFWARGSNLRRLKQRFDQAHPEAARLPRGLAFHVAPANVDTIFVYSLLLSVMSGNTNIVRLSTRGGEQTDLLLSALGQALAEASEDVRSSLTIVRYGHEKSITDAFSLRANLRVVWGGDETVRLIRESPLAPAGVELVFPNRFSLAVFDAEAWIEANDKPRIAALFANDVLWFGQMACSSPRAVVWRGSEASAARASAGFWPMIDQAAKTAGYVVEPAGAVAKLLGEQEAAADYSDRILDTGSNRLRVINRGGLERLDHESLPGDGFFTEHRIERIGELARIAGKHWQTIVSFGVSAADWRAALEDAVPLGIDRIVRPGAALDFDSVWDGVDLITAMTRIVSISVD